MVAVVAAPAVDVLRGRAAPLAAGQVRQRTQPASVREFLAALAPGARIRVAVYQAGTSKDAEAGALSLVSPEAVIFTNGKETTVVPLASIKYVAQHATGGGDVATYLYLWGEQH
jgi:hypothetical protein